MKLIARTNPIQSKVKINTRSLSRVIRGIIMLKVVWSKEVRKTGTG